jgi:predicted Rossmann-fold nucleotide-binding protein
VAVINTIAHLGAMALDRFGLCHDHCEGEIMIGKLAHWTKNVVFCLTLSALVFPGAASGHEPRGIVKEATPEEIQAFFKKKKMTVLTFLGYSGAEYEDKAEMLKQAAKILAQLDPKSTIVNIGATPQGIGAVYDLAKSKGFLTTGIVSTQARENKVALSPNVDMVFYVKDNTWGGFLPGTKCLSPTSKALVENSDVIVAIGGGEVARDELLGARQLGKRVQYIPADMNHQMAREKALKKSQPEPTNFGGAAGTIF